MAKHPFVKLQQHIDQEQWTSAMALLGKQKILQQLDCTRTEVRHAVGIVCAMYAETGNMSDPHFPQVMVRVMERCQNHDWLLQFGDERFAMEDYETALHSYTAARLQKNTDEHKHTREEIVKTKLIEKAKELCMEGMPMQAFAFVKRTDAFALLSEPELAKAIAKAAQQYWNARLPELETPKKYHQMGLLQVEEMLMATDQIDVLYTMCATSLFAKVQEECKAIHNGTLPEQQSWQHEYLRVVRRVLDMQVGREVLSHQELESIGEYGLTIGNTQIAWTAFLKQGNTTKLEELVCTLTKMPNAENAREICAIIDQVGVINLRTTTIDALRAFQLRLLYLLPKDTRKKSTDQKDGERLRIEYYCQKISNFLTEYSRKNTREE